MNDNSKDACTIELYDPVGVKDEPHFLTIQTYTIVYNMDEQNPLDDLISFPADVTYLRADTRPDESHGWGLHLVLELPRSIVQNSLAQQLTMAGFVEETSVGQPGLLRFIREDAYVWGMVSPGPEGRTALFLSITQAKPEGEDVPPPDWALN